MDQRGNFKRKVSPKENANIFQKMFFTYSFPIMWKGYKKDLVESDIHEVVTKLKSDKAGDQLEKQWLLDNKNGKRTSMLTVMFKIYWKKTATYGILELILQILFAALLPHATSKLVKYFTPGQTEVTFNLAFFYSAITISLGVLDFLAYHNYFLWINEMGLLARTAFCSMIYRKCLKLSPTALSKFSTGKIVTLMTKDTDIILTSFNYLNNIWIVVIRIIVISYLLWNKVGNVAFGGIGFLFVILPIQVYIAQKTSAVRKATSQRTDKRLQSTQDVLSAIKIIKMYTWEKIFARKICDRRKEEVKIIRHVFYLKAISIALGHLSSEISLFIVIMMYIYLGHNVQGELIYFIVNSFEYLRNAIAYMVPFTIISFSELLTATRRIESLMRAPEVTPQSPTTLETIKPNIKLNKICVKFEQKLILSNISLTLSSGLNVVTGNLGSGKSTLLKTILQDYPVTSGTLSVEGKISYACQDPWLFPSTIKQNILFGEKFNEERYRKVLEVTALKYDLGIFVNGDETIVEQGGMNLSKGQQARVNLARAIYREADIYLLDDCLSALDTSVQAHIFYKCIKTFLKNKLCLLVSHDQQYSKVAENIIVLDSGVVKEIIKPEVTETFFKNSIDIEKLIQSDRIIESEEDFKVKSDELDSFLKKVDNHNIYHEVKKEGAVNWSVYKKYFSFGGHWCFMALILTLFGGKQFAASMSDKLVSTWVDLEQNLTQLRLNASQNSTEYTNLESKHSYTLKLYAIALPSACVLTLVSSFAYYIFVSNAAVKLHKKMINQIVSATLEFFDYTFIGNIINRFSRDLAGIDETLPFDMLTLFVVVLDVVGVFSLVVSVKAIFLLPATIALVFAISIRRFYISSGRSLKRLGSATRSPVIGHLSATIEGLTTIRAFGVQNVVSREFDRHQDLYTSVYNMGQFTERAFSQSMGMCTEFFICTILITTLFLSEFSAGDAGLILTQSFRLAGTIHWSMHSWSQLENNMTSVERVIEYTEVKTENPAGLNKENWPSKGGIKYENLSLTYAKTNETVLRNVNIEILPKEKIGIVGRTGAGKSTIIECLYRFYDTKGTISIDGTDIKTVTLNSLRSNLSIIPQDPILFRGTIRSNIDPLSRYSDEEIWSALRVVKMDKVISDLNFEIVSVEANFSQGQKQLISLARALVRKNKIIILDEATANLDAETDLLINEVIKNEFSDCTVLTVAHKINSIIDSDKVVVVDRGEVVEFDSPRVLLERNDGLFTAMVRKNR